jgi:choline dehydrogenase-like flavoprotein
MHTQPPLRPANVFGRQDLSRDLDLGCDVVIVGSGAGGATMAAELAEEGLDVIVLEEGGYHRTEDFTPRPLEMIRKLYRDAGTSGTLGVPPVLYQEGRLVGGSSVLNGGMSWRTPEHILERWHREDHIDRILPADMEPFFARVESRINVAYQDPETLSRDNALLKEAADQKGWKVIDNRRNQLHCAGTNNCAFGCPTGAKRSTLVTYIPRALAFGARIYSDVRVSRVLRQGKRAVGVEGHVTDARGQRGPRLRVRAKLVVVACGSVQTPALLLRSGLGARGGHLGRNLSLHPNAKVVALFDEDIRGWEGAHQSYQVREFQRQGFLMAAVNIPPAIVALTSPRYGAQLQEFMNDYNKMVIAGILVEDTSLGRVVSLPGGGALPLYSLNQLDVEKLKQGVGLLCELLLSAGARKILLPFDGSPDIHNLAELRAALASPIPRGAMEVVTVHLMGSARMGRDRSQSVADSYGHVHDAERLVISDASLFPSPIGVNPCQTIQALSTRNAAWILNNRRRFLS